MSLIISIKLLIVWREKMCTRVPTLVDYNRLEQIEATVQLKGNLIPARRWRAGQPWVDQQNPSKQA